MAKAINKIQNRRGLEFDLPTLAEGEQAWTTDTHKLFIGSSDGNKQVGAPPDMTAYQEKNDNGLSTTAKTVVGGINELAAGATKLKYPDGSVKNVKNYKMTTTTSAGQIQVTNINSIAEGGYCRIKFSLIPEINPDAMNNFTMYFGRGDGYSDVSVNFTESWGRSPIVGVFTVYFPSYSGSYVEGFVSKTVAGELTLSPPKISFISSGIVSFGSLGYFNFAPGSTVEIVNI